MGIAMAQLHVARAQVEPTVAHRSSRRHCEEASEATALQARLEKVLGGTGCEPVRSGEQTVASKLTNGLLLHAFGATTALFSSSARPVKPGVARLREKALLCLLEDALGAEFSTEERAAASGKRLMTEGRNLVGVEQRVRKAAREATRRAPDADAELQIVIEELLQLTELHEHCCLGHLFVYSGINVTLSLCDTHASPSLRPCGRRA